MLILNSFLMSDERMGKYIESWNKFKPKQVWAYTSSILEFARYINRRGIHIHPPISIICAAETLTEDVRTVIEKAFLCPALNQYGSREAGAIACECLKKEGLHVFSLNNKVEILNNNLELCRPGQIGKVYITTLNNYSMPLIRYDIGDMATVAENTKCSCGRGWPLIANVVGRHIETFKTRDGRVVPGQFFIHFVGVVYNEGFIKRFQVVQKDYDKILVRVVVADEDKFSSRKQDITESFRRVLGQDCKVDFEYVDDIPPAKSGKYLYTISELKE
jgi:phenylacetate-CoA ligase